MSVTTAKAGKHPRADSPGETLPLDFPGADYLAGWAVGRLVKLGNTPSKLFTMSFDEISFAGSVGSDGASARDRVTGVSAGFDIGLVEVTLRSSIEMPAMILRDTGSVRLAGHLDRARKQGRNSHAEPAFSDPGFAEAGALLPKSLWLTCQNAAHYGHPAYDAFLALER